MQRAWKDLGELEERQRQGVSRLAAKTWENLLAMGAEAADFNHRIFPPDCWWLLRAATLAFVHPKLYSWPRKDSLALPVARKIVKTVFYSLLNHLSPDMHFVVRRLSACILIGRLLCQLGVFIIIQEKESEQTATILSSTIAL